MKKRGIAGGGGRAGFVAALVLGSVLAACSNGGDGLLFLIDPGKYQYHSCAQLATTTTSQSARLQELATLIERAEQGVAGAVVGTIAYKSEYTAIAQDLKLLAAAARAKDCAIASTWRSNSAIQ
jgi:hypothetical protein